MSSYSLDLRSRVVAAYERGDGSHDQIAKRYDIHADTVRSWCRRHRLTGSVAPLSGRGGPPRRLNDEDRAFLKQLAMERNDATLMELSDALIVQRGVRAGLSTIHGFLKAEGITRKKRLGAQASDKHRNGKLNV